MKNSVRRKDREISREEALELLDSTEYGVLSMVDKDGDAYGIPINHVRKDDRLIFHCALEGRKLDCLKSNPRASFCVVGRTKPLPEKFSTEYESAIVQGTVEIIEDETRKIEDLRILCEKFTPEHLEAAEKAITKSLHRTGIFELRMETITGKAMKSTSV